MGFTDLRPEAADNENPVAYAPGWCRQVRFFFVHIKLIGPPGIPLRSPAALGLHRAVPTPPIPPCNNKHIISWLAGLAFSPGSTCTVEKTDKGLLAPCGSERNVVLCLAASALAASALQLEERSDDFIVDALIALIPQLAGMASTVVNGEPDSIQVRFQFLQANFQSSAINRKPDDFDFFLIITDRSRRLFVSPHSVAGAVPPVVTA